MMRHPYPAAVILVAAFLAPSAMPAHADEATVPANGTSTPAPMPQSTDSLYGSNVSEYFQKWFERSDYARATQPNWMTPIVTVTPRLEQEVRSDQYFEVLGNGSSVNQYDSGKLLELIPTTTEEILINPPAYMVRNGPKPISGFGDDPFLIVKQRLLSANEENGNCILTVFLGLQAPTGITAFTANAWEVTPTIAGGKGWGDFDIQSTLSLAIPTANANVIGDALIWNTTYQYHFLTYFWPEFDTAVTHWYGGLRDEKTQVFLSAGMLLGRFEIYGRAKAVIGAAYQWAVTPKMTETPVLTPLYNHAWILSARMPF